MANLRLVFAGLPRLDEPADVYRLEAAAYCLDHGVAPRSLMKALNLDTAVLDLRKFNSEQPRVPAGHGRESGQWTGERSQGGSTPQNSKNEVPETSPKYMRMLSLLRRRATSATPVRL